MNKQLIKLSLLSGLVLSSNIAQASQPSDAFTGPYLGAGLGYMHDETTFNAQAYDTDGVPQDEPANNNLSRESRYNAFSGSVSGGYGHTFSHGIYTAAELKFSYYNNYDPKNSSGGKIIYKYGYNATLKLGKVINDDFLVYLKGGYINTKMDYENPKDDYALAKKDSSMRGGYEFGFGFGYKMTDCLVLGLEASRSVYEKYTFTQGGNPDERNIEVRKTHKPRLEQVELKLTYQF